MHRYVITCLGRRRPELLVRSKPRSGPAGLAPATGCRRCAAWPPTWASARARSPPPTGRSGSGAWPRAMAAGAPESHQACRCRGPPGPRQRRPGLRRHSPAGETWRSGNPDPALLPDLRPYLARIAAGSGRTGRLYGEPAQRADLVDLARAAVRRRRHTRPEPGRDGRRPRWHRTGAAGPSASGRSGRGRGPRLPGGAGPGRSPGPGGAAGGGRRRGARPGRIGAGTVGRRGRNGAHAPGPESDRRGMVAGPGRPAAGGAAPPPRHPGHRGRPRRSGCRRARA